MNAAHDTEPAPPPDTEPTHEIPEHPFHKHLAGCKQCREQPFNLCAVGGGLIMGIFTAATGWP